MCIRNKRIDMQESNTILKMAGSFKRYVKDKNLSMDSIKQKAFYIAMSEKYDKIYLDTKGAVNGKRSLL